MVEGLLRLGSSDEPYPVNLGNPAELTILEFAKRIQAATGSKDEIVFKPLPQDDPRMRRPDITKARKLLGWEPKVPLEQGLKETVEYFRSLAATSRV
jgi:dTDP-glucose 4,6-dehydratase